MTGGPTRTTRTSGAGGPRRWSASLGVRPPDHVLTAVCGAVAPGARVAHVRRLRGGQMCGNHVLRLLTRSGSTREVVLRRYPIGEPPATADRLARTLDALEPTGLPVPRLLYADPAGDLTGTPSLVTSLVPGRIWITPPDPIPWARQIANALVAVHEVPGAAMQFLPTPNIRRHERPASLSRATGGLFDQLTDVVARHERTLRRGGAVLQHGDFWCCNLLWWNARHAGTVDWDMARRGPRAYDLAYARLDLALLFGPEVADAFTARYWDLAGTVAVDTAAWDGMHALDAIRTLDLWLAGYADAGAPIDRHTAETRLCDFARDAIRRCR